MKEKIDRIKTKIKHRVPEIIVATSVVAGIASTYLLTKNQGPGEMLIPLDPDEWAKLTSGESLYVESDAGMIYMHIEA